jgi:hypothetical protein
VEQESREKEKNSSNGAADSAEEDDGDGTAQSKVSGAGRDSRDRMHGCPASTAQHEQAQAVSGQAGEDASSRLRGHGVTHHEFTGAAV